MLINFASLVELFVKCLGVSMKKLEIFGVVYEGIHCGDSERAWNYTC